MEIRSTHGKQPEGARAKNIAYAGSGAIKSLPIDDPQIKIEENQITMKTKDGVFKYIHGTYSDTGAPRFAFMSNDDNIRPMTSEEIKNFIIIADTKFKNAPIVPKMKDNVKNYGDTMIFANKDRGIIDIDLPDIGLKIKYDKYDEYKGRGSIVIYEYKNDEWDPVGGSHYQGSSRYIQFASGYLKTIDLNQKDPNYKDTQDLFNELKNELEQLKKEGHT